MPPRLTRVTAARKRGPTVTLGGARLVTPVGTVVPHEHAGSRGRAALRPARARPRRGGGVRRPARVRRTPASPYPISAVSPSVPIDEPPRRRPYAARHHATRRSSPDLPLPRRPHDRQRAGARGPTTSPLGWQPYAVCSTASELSAAADHRHADARRSRSTRQPEVRFRPPGEPTSGGYSLRVRILDNTFVDVHQMVGTKIVGFRDSADRRLPASCTRRPRRCTSTTATPHQPPPLQLLPVVRGPGSHRTRRWRCRCPGRAARRAGPQGAVRPVRRQRAGDDRALPPGKAQQQGAVSTDG